MLLGLDAVSWMHALDAVCHGCMHLIMGLLNIQTGLGLTLGRRMHHKMSTNDIDELSLRKVFFGIYRVFYSPQEKNSSGPRVYSMRERRTCTDGGRPQSVHAYAHSMLHTAHDYTTPHHSTDMHTCVHVVRTRTQLHTAPPAKVFLRPNIYLIYPPALSSSLSSWSNSSSSSLSSSSSSSCSCSLSSSSCSSFSDSLLRFRACLCLPARRYTLMPTH